jgi:hypothetical protein
MAISLQSLCAIAQRNVYAQRRGDGHLQPTVTRHWRQVLNVRSRMLAHH